MQNILIVGGDHLERVRYALNFASMLLCTNSHDKPCHNCPNCQRISSHTHPNLMWVSPVASETKEDDSLGFIKVDQMRQIVLEHQKSSFENGTMIFIITHMHRATPSAANALLKVMEEYHQKKIFIALAPSRSSVLKTIASRLSIVNIKPPPLDHAPLDQARALFITKICSLSKKDRFDECRHLGTTKEEIALALEELSKTCHGMVRNNTFAPHVALGVLESIYKAQRDLKKNLNPRLVIEHMLLVQWPFCIGDAMA